ncbi:dienelactone hydrolase family protein [Mucilaginibacter arboris]|uniref:Dienelactone hydrolase family protein n=1 Tax=Mucilaginibacter arboris TaxID=2682090 RepID=A0A7K1SY61_9SPHI|nr:dienelactone hydrolase family protein [Mucilaginibacter arboris]MVN22259.1 dienelactone hydrolase family protein [Mucilaginibacter arboris]
MKKTLLLAFAFTLVLPLANAQLKSVTYLDGNQKLTGFAIKPQNPTQKKAGILVLPAWMGIDAHAKETAEQLAKLGYYAFVADIYGEGNYPKSPAEAGKLAGSYKKDYKAYQHRIDLAMQQLIKSGADASRIAAIGFCFGGTGVLEMARANFPVKGVVSFHGGLGKDASRPAEQIKPKVLVCHGADDPNEPQAEILAFQQEMRDSKADWQMIFYGNSVHSFTDPAAGNDNSKGAAYNGLAAKRSWEHMKLFLDEVFAQ